MVRDKNCVVLPFLAHTCIHKRACTHIHLTGVSQVHSLSRFQPEVGCVPCPARDGRLAGSIPPHGSPASLPSRVGSLHHHLPLSDDPPLDGTFIQKVRSDQASVSCRILSWGGKQDGSRMIVACEVCVYLLGGSGGMPPLGKF